MDLLDVQCIANLTLMSKIILSTSRPSSRTDHEDLPTRPGDVSWNFGKRSILSSVNFASVYKSISIWQFIGIVNDASPILQSDLRRGHCVAIARRRSAGRVRGQLSQLPRRNRRTAVSSGASALPTRQQLVGSGTDIDRGWRSVVARGKGRHGLHSVRAGQSRLGGAGGGRG